MMEQPEALRLADVCRQHDTDSMDEAAAELRRLHAENERMRVAAQAVVDRWDSPLWKDLPHTGEFINALREAIKEQQ